MTVGSVGGVGVSAGAGASASAGGVTAAASSPQLPDGTISLSDGGVILPNSTPGGVAALAELLEGFSTAEIILAMLFLAASREKDDASSSSDGLLAGLAMAGAIGGSLTLNVDIQSVSAVADASQLGTQLDLSS